MLYMGFVVGGAAVFLLSLLVRSVWIGHRIGVHTAQFEHEYNEALRQGHTWSEALHQALMGLRSCPKLNRLDDGDRALIVEMLGGIPNSDKIITKVIVDMDSDKAVSALKDKDFLSSITEIYTRNG